MLSSIGGYVGQIRWQSIPVFETKNRKNTLAVDIGTNGEILLLTPMGNYTCSAAAGPALEGGSAVCGMRAAEGAIDTVAVSGRFPMQDLMYHVIGEGNPLGICGSGLLDAVACLLKCGVIDQENSVYLTSEDVRQLQLAIGAIRTGAEVLLEKAELTADDVDGVYLAGAGAAMALLSEQILTESKMWVKELCHVELAQDEKFEELFLKYMNFAGE